MTSDADNFLHLSRSHHVSLGRWLGDKPEEFYSPTQPRDKGGRFSRIGGRGFQPSSTATQARSDYRREQGIAHFPVPEGIADVVVDPKARARAAAAYARMPEFDPAAVPAYRALRDEVNRQFEYMTQKLGIKVEVTDTDPYANVDEMMKDIVENKTLKVLSTASTGGHPFFTNEENDRFRAVHDFFGHAGTGRDFSRHGERASFMSHASMMKNKDSIRALFTETEMQNAALIANRGEFQQQKIGLAPDELVFEGLDAGNGIQASAAIRGCLSKACAPPPVGHGGSTKVSRTRLRGAGKGLGTPDSGFTLTPKLKPVREGFAVAVAGTERYMNAKDAYLPDGSVHPKLKAFIVDRLKALSSITPPHGARLAIGGWHNPADGVLEINITVVFPSNEGKRAAAFARKGDQISMAHLKPDGSVDFIDTGGTGGDRTVTAAATLKNPKGGLTPAGRKAFGGNLKPGVKNYTSASLADKKRWISWARRFYGRKVYPPLVDNNGEPTRFALTAWAWGEPVPKTEAEARKIAAKAEVRAAALKEAPDGK